MSELCDIHDCMLYRAVLQVTNVCLWVTEETYFLHVTSVLGNRISLNKRNFCALCNFSSTTALLYLVVTSFNNNYNVLLYILLSGVCFAASTKGFYVHCFPARAAGSMHNLPFFTELQTKMA